MKRVAAFYSNSTSVMAFVSTNDEPVLVITTNGRITDVFYAVQHSIRELEELKASARGIQRYLAVNWAVRAMETQPCSTSLVMQHKRVMVLKQVFKQVLLTSPFAITSSPQTVISGRNFGLDLKGDLVQWNGTTWFQSETRNNVSSHELLLTRAIFRLVGDRRFGIGTIQDVEFDPVFGEFRSETDICWTLGSTTVIPKTVRNALVSTGLVHQDSELWESRRSIYPRQSFKPKEHIKLLAKLILDTSWRQDTTQPIDKGSDDMEAVFTPIDQTDELKRLQDKITGLESEMDAIKERTDDATRSVIKLRAVLYQALHALETLDRYPDLAGELYEWNEIADAIRSALEDSRD
jgi:hypothetical protein